VLVVFVVLLLAAIKIYKRFRKAWK
jgi:hypothetical protein